MEKKEFNGQDLWFNQLDRSEQFKTFDDSDRDIEKDASQHHCGHSMNFMDVSFVYYLLLLS